MGSIQIETATINRGLVLEETWTAVPKHFNGPIQGQWVEFHLDSKREVIQRSGVNVNPPVERFMIRLDDLKAILEEIEDAE